MLIGPPRITAAAVVGVGVVAAGGAPPAVVVLNLSDMIPLLAHAVIRLGVCRDCLFLGGSVGAAGAGMMLLLCASLVLLSFPSLM